uniref:Uncharacterized protein n=1 Tax=Haloferax sp. (strain Q22) TaxID=1526048 RepID=A0A0H3YA03_HALS0|nr:hypothetical protein [Haloferax sp. Q22]AKN10607.1 hypothetical protein [Haloferax sp. Q22]
MVEAACHRCGREWDYTGSSDHYGTCPNCKTSVKLHGGSERAEPSETAERCPDPSDRTTVEVDGEAVPVAEAVERLNESLEQVRATGEARGESLGELGRDVEARAETVADLRRGLEELAEYFKELMEEAGGEVDYDHIDPGRTVPSALENVDMEGFEA